MTNNFERIDDNTLRLRQAFLEHQIDTSEPDDPHLKALGEAMIDIAQERQKRLLGKESTSHTAQLRPGGMPIDTERWRK